MDSTDQKNPNDKTTTAQARRVNVRPRSQSLDVGEAFDGHLQWLKARAQSKPTDSVGGTDDAGEEYKLPNVPGALRVSPNEMCRMALFTVRRGPRRQYFDEHIFLTGDGEVTYTGIELRAENDELIWLQCLHYARGQNLAKNGWVQFTPSQMCKELGWTPGGPNYKLLRESLLRLKATALVLQTKTTNYGEAVSLIGDFKWRKPDGKPDSVYCVAIPEKIALWFGENNFTRLNWEIYRKLPPIARRLYDWGASHRVPFAIKLQTVFDLCGSDADSLVNFRKVLRRSIKVLNESGVFKNVALDRSGLLRIERHAERIA